MQYENGPFGSKKITLDDVDAHRLSTDFRTAGLGLEPGDVLKTNFWGVFGGDTAAVVAEVLDGAGRPIIRINHGGSQEELMNG